MASLQEQRRKEHDSLAQHFNFPDFLTNKTVIPDPTGDKGYAPRNETDSICKGFEKNSVYCDLNKIPQQPTVVSSAHGKIKKILLAYPGWKLDPMYRNMLKDLILRLPYYTTFYLFAESETSTMLGPSERPLRDDLMLLERETNYPESEKIHLISDEHLSSYSIWTQDPFIVVEDAKKQVNNKAEDNTTFLIEPFKFSISDTIDRSTIDARIANTISDNSIPDLSVDHNRVPIIFQGGNILIAEDFILVGMDSFKRTLQLLKLQKWEAAKTDDGKINSKSAIKLFKRIFGEEKEVFCIGSTRKSPLHIQSGFETEEGGQKYSNSFLSDQGQFQPLFHLDMFISLAGYVTNEEEYTIVIGDPRNATGVINEDLDKHYFYPLKREMDKIAKALEGKTFQKNGQKKRIRIVRCALPQAYVEKGEKRVWRTFSYNNCLVEIDGTNRRVWLPSYGNDPTYPETRFLYNFDKEVAEFWRKELHFSVTTLESFFPYVLNQGSVHCLTKVLDRH